MIERQQLQDLLTEINKICLVAEQKRKERESRGEYYNVFNILGLWSEEVRLHSAFIAELLNPNGIHGLGDKCLKAFLKQATIDEDYINVNNVNPDIVERKIGYINETGTEGGRIDIILDDGSHALIIENKIYAGDQPNQLLRYSNYAQKFAGFKLIYLTLDGHEPSTYSTGNVDKKEPLNEHDADESSAGENVEYKCMSYREDIIAWLIDCAKIAFAHPLVRETINQYIQLIKQLTNINMEDKDINEVANIAIENKNIDSTIAIFEAQNEISKGIREKYIFGALKTFAKEKSLDFELIDDTNEHSILFSKPNWPKKAGIYVYNDPNNWSWVKMYMGISYPETKKTQPKLDCLNRKPDGYWPYGWENLPINDWESPNSYKAIKDGKVAKWIEDKIDEILDELERKKITL